MRVGGGDGMEMDGHGDDGGEGDGVDRADMAGGVNEDALLEAMMDGDP